MVWLDEAWVNSSVCRDSHFAATSEMVYIDAIASEVIVIYSDVRDIV